MDSASLNLRIGTRVRVKRIRVRGHGVQGGESGTIIGTPAEGRAGLCPVIYPVLLDSEGIRGFAPDALEVSDVAVDQGLRVAARVLDERREHLLHDLVCLVAADRRADLRDPGVRQQVEADVRRMTANWGDADAERLRRQEFTANPELRKRVVKGLTAYLELGDLLQQVAGLIDDGESLESPADVGHCR